MRSGSLLRRQAEAHRRERDVRSNEGSGMTVWIYVDTRKQIGDVDHLRVFASEDAANAWFAEHDPEDVAFEYPVME
jgi:hypothetical protein